MDRNLGGILVTRKLNRAENTAQDGRKDMEFPGKRDGMDKRKIAISRKRNMKTSRRIPLKKSTRSILFDALSRSTFFHIDRI